MRNVLIFSILFTIISGCQYLQPKEETTERVVASVGEKNLTETTIIDLMPPNQSKVDSAVFAEKFILDWIKKQLMIGEAKEAIDFNEAQIQKKVLDYQYALMVHELEQKYVRENINEHISGREIQAYYSEKAENFLLRQNLAKCMYFKIPSSAPNIWRFRKSLKNYPKDSTQLWEYANKHAVKAFLEDTVWVKFDEVLQETPLTNINDRAAFLKNNRSLEVSDDTYVYFLKIFDHRTIGEVAPLEFIRESVSEIILNKRKIALKRELERTIYEEAEQTNAFEIYSN